MLQGAVGVISSRSPLLMIESSASNMNQIAKLLPKYSFYEINTQALILMPISFEEFSLIKLFIGGYSELLELGLETEDILTIYYVFLLHLRSLKI